MGFTKYLTTCNSGPLADGFSKSFSSRQIALSEGATEHCYFLPIGHSERTLKFKRLFEA